jgi:hypothetical protein
VTAQFHSLLPRAAVLLSAPTPAAADAFYLGKWKIIEAKVAPWTGEKVRKPDTAEMRSRVGTTVTIEAKAIRGPHALAFTDVRYTVVDYPADMLFQGAFGEMHERDKSADPVRIAEKIGFRGSRWKTLETGCVVEVDYHSIDPDTAAFGLNDYVHVLNQQPQEKAQSPGCIPKLRQPVAGTTTLRVWIVSSISIQRITCFGLP